MLTLMTTTLLVLGGNPGGTMDPTVQLVPALRYEALDVAALRSEDDRRHQQGLPLRFAIPQEVMITPANSGLWDRAVDGRLRWRLRVAGTSVPHFNFGFEYWNMPDSGELTIVASDGTYSAGPFSSLDNMDHGEFWSPVILGEDVLLTITCDDDDRRAVENGIGLTKVNIGYRGFGADSAGLENRSGSCNIDVACSDADDWQSEVACVGLYTINGSLTCTGSMLNNTARDERPFYLTADHCGVRTNNSQSMVFYWNYENSFCRTPNSGAAGGSGNGNFNDFTSGGAIYRAGSGNSDFVLVELNNDPNPSFNVGFCGWDRRTAIPSGGVAIHHPQLLEKRISFENDSLSSQGSYWFVNDWDAGTTEPGSSGSPLFSLDRRVVGQLFGGLAACNNDLYDQYGKLSSSWNSGLSGFLDYAGTGEQFVETLGGIQPGACCTTSGTCVGNTSVDICDSVGGNFFEGVSCDSALIDCSPSGACCQTDGSCTVATSNQCSANGGNFNGAGTSCNSNPCPQPPPTGACCLASSSCQSLSADDCSSASGTYQGDDSGCEFVDCEQQDIVTFVQAQRGANLLTGATVGPTFTTDVYVTVPQGFRVEAVAGNSAQSKVISATNGFYQNAFGGPTSTSINPSLLDVLPDLRYDSFITLGSLDSSDNNLQTIGIDFDAFEELGAPITSSDGTWFVLQNDSQGDAQLFTAQDCSQQYGVLIARLTAKDLSSTISFDALIQGRDAGGNTWQDRASYTFSYDASMIDCNGNLINDTCDIANGVSADANGDGVPDECGGPACPGDTNGDLVVNVDDLLKTIADFGKTGEGVAGDVTNDNIVNVDDVLLVISVFDTQC